MKIIYRYIKKVFSKNREVMISRKVKNYENDPFFVQKADEAKAVLDKYGFPKELLIK